MSVINTQVLHIESSVIRRIDIGSNRSQSQKHYFTPTTRTHKVSLNTCSCRILKMVQLYGSHTLLLPWCFLSAFAKLRKATMSFVMSVRPSVCLRGTRLPLNWLPWNLIF